MTDDPDSKKPGFGDLESPFLFVPHGAPEPVEWMRKHPGWVKFPATFVPRAPAAVRTIPGTNRPWPLDKRGQPWPKSRFGQPLRPLDEYPPGVRAPGERYTGPIADPVEAMRAASASKDVLAQAAKLAADPDAPIRAYLGAMEVWKDSGKYAGYPRTETAFVRVAETSSPERATAAPDQVAVESLDRLVQSGASPTNSDLQPFNSRYATNPLSSEAVQHGPFVEDLPVLRDPFNALLHYVRGSGSPVQYPFSDIDTSEVRTTHFKKVQELLKSGRNGEFAVRDYMGFATSGFTSAAFVGRISLLLEGSLVVREDGSYSFTGMLAAHPDRYRFYQTDSRTVIGEASTRVGELLPGAPFWVVITGTKSVVENGKD